jgi:hypothetical protein
MNENYTASDVARVLNLSRDNDIIPFLELKQYIQRENDHRVARKGNLVATALGIESGCVFNRLYKNGKYNRIQFFITEKGIQKIENAFYHKDDLEPVGLEEVSVKLAVNKSDLLRFLEIKQYIKLESTGWKGTGMGVDLGYVKNVGKNMFLTKAGMNKLETAFARPKFTPEEEKRIEAICQEAEKTMHPTWIGKAE